MKKNISINISGIIFHIEEDGYDTLKGYLDAISKYFASYEDNEEIVADIEGRIAEIFLSKLKEDKQVISKIDVEALIQTMGQVSDFVAMESEEDHTSEEKNQTKSSNTKKEKNQTQNTSGKRWERDTQRQLVGGVSVGLAHYLKTDPLWIRGAFIFSAFVGGLGVLIYPILWIVLPGNDHIPENDSIRKFYRDPDDKVIGGVSGGLGKYFRTDPLIWRILFIVLFFGGGFGLLTYVVLWIITPKANSLTDKMQMKGEKVTISNIDSTIKRNKQDELNPKGENTFTKIILFPFRLVGQIFSGLGRALAPLMLFLVAAIRVFIGAIISIVGVSVMFSLLVTAGVLFGFYNGEWFMWEPGWTYFPYEVFRNTIPGIGVLFLLTTVFIPFLYVFIAGITIIAKRRIMTTSFGWSVLGIWVIALFGSFAILPNVIRDFRDEGIYRESDLLAIQADTLTIDINHVDYEYYSFYGNRSNRAYDYESDFADLDIRPSNDGEFRLDKRFRARGRNSRVAEDNAQQVEFNYTIEGNKITFDSDITFSRNAKFYFQEVDADLYIPLNQPFKIERDARSLIRYLSYKSSWWEISRNTWMFDDDKNLVCLTCKDTDSKEVVSIGESMIESTSPFNTLEVSKQFEVEYIESDQNKLEFEGPSILLKNLEWKNSGEKIDINVTGAYSEDWSRVKIKVFGQGLEKISLKQGAQLDYRNADFDFLTVSLDDDSRLNLNGIMGELDLYLYANSRVDLSGNANKVKLYGVGESRVYGYDLNVSEAEIETESEARVRLKVTDFLTAEASGFSSVRYKGEPTVDIKDKSKSASISKY